MNQSHLSVQEGFLSGCGVPHPCVPMEVHRSQLFDGDVWNGSQASALWDECRFDISHCGEMVPNSFCWNLRSLESMA